jgi:hypothetical protein
MRLGRCWFYFIIQPLVYTEAFYFCINFHYQLSEIQDNKNHRQF